MPKVYNKVSEVVSESSGRTYTISKDENGKLSCNCPSWIFKSRHALEDGQRFCKHIEQYWRDMMK